MTTSLLSPPEAPPSPEPGPRGLPGRRPLAALLITCALLGGAASAGVLAATGALDGDGATTTTVVRPASGAADTSASTSGGSATTLNAEALYASTSSGVVDISAKGGTAGSATGSGFVIDGQGHILTAAHVVDGASSITVTLDGGRTRTATVLGTDDATDVAVLKIDPSGLTLHPLRLGSSSSLSVGDAVAAIGSPFGYERSISTGIVSGVDRTIEAPNGFTVAHAIQTDAALNPGNSGGPVLNSAGEVVGIADQIATNGGSDQSSGVGFAVPIDLVRAELAQLEAGKAVSHAYLGVSTSDSDAATAGALVGQVVAGGPAASAGVRAGDVVTKIGDTTVTSSNDLVAAVAAHRPGDRVQVTVRRGSQAVTVTVQLGTQPAQRGNGG